MYGAGNKLFARPRFTGDENRRVARRDFGDAREYGFQSRGCSNDLLKHGGLVNFFTQGYVFASKSVFSALSIFDVRSGKIPTCSLSLLVTQWIKTSQEPAVGSITVAQSQLELVSNAV